MSVPVTVWGVKETISEHPILKATFTVVNPEQISQPPLSGHSDLDLDKVTFFKKEGRYELVNGREHIEKAIAQSLDNLAAGQSVTISFGLEVRGCFPKALSSRQALAPSVSTNKQLPETPQALNAVHTALKNLRLKALAARASFGQAN